MIDMLGRYLAARDALESFSASSIQHSADITRQYLYDIKDQKIQEETNEKVR